MPQIKLDGRWCSDGGLLNPLPVWAAVELGATDILALHVLAEFPSKLMKPPVLAFRYIFGQKVTIPAGVRVRMIAPSERLGGMRDTLHASAANADRWLELGARDATATFSKPLGVEKPFPF